jgi:hypothetical protein
MIGESAGILMKKTTTVLAGTVTAAFGASTGLAADVPETPVSLPAISAPNGKLAVSGGVVDYDFTKSKARYHLEGAYSLPLGHEWGLQADGVIGRFSGKTAGSGGLHLFTRDPASHLLGLHATYTGIGSNDIFRIGPEIEWYLGNFTLQGWAGYEDSDTNNGKFFASAEAVFYPDPNLKLYVGYRRTLQIDAGAVGFEWLTNGGIFDGAPLALYSEGQFGDKKEATVWVGIRFYFGPDPAKSLIRRHREDDPDNKEPTLHELPGDGCRVFTVIDGITNCDPKFPKDKQPS